MGSVRDTVWVVLGIEVTEIHIWTWNMKRFFESKVFMWNILFNKANCLGLEVHFSVENSKLISFVFATEEDHLGLDMCSI